MRTPLLAVLLAASIVAPAQTAAPIKKPVPRTDSTSAATVELPVRRVVLYKNGVGYFEHAGRVRGSQDLSIKFTTAQLNDVLKSLTVVDLAGQVNSVRYNSIAPLSERLSTLRVQLPENPTREDFLRAMLGARVEVRGGTSSATGRLLSVDKVSRQDKNDRAIEVIELAVMNDAGDLRTFELTPALSVRFTDAELNREVARYMQLISTSRAKDVRFMTIGTSGEGERNVAVSYISEVPVWKSTYRVVLPDKAGDKALLQGWAIVDNTVGEDWKDVQLTLVAGAPQSFIQQISQPLYMRRPTVALPTTAQLTPQTHEGTLKDEGVAGGTVGGIPGPPPPPPAAMPMSKNVIEVGQGRGGGFAGGTFRVGGGVAPNMAQIHGQLFDLSGAIIPNAQITLRADDGSTRTARTDANGQYTFYSLRPGSYALTFSSSGFQPRQMGVYARSGGITEANASLNVGAATETIAVEAASPEVNADSISLSDESVAAGAEIGDLFQYALKQRVTVLQNQSALVPIVQARIDAEKVTIWNGQEQYPLRALWLKNSSGSTLDGGTFNIIEANAFAGEGVFKELKPDERRLMSYAADTAVRVKNETVGDDQPYTHVKIVRGLMTLTREQRETNTYTIRNSDTSEKNVVIEHPARDGWKFLGDLKPEESTTDYHRFRVKVAPGKTETLKVAEFRPDFTQLFITSITSDQFVLFTRGRTVSPQLQQAVQEILAKKNEIAAVDVKLNDRRNEIGRISQDQNRLRENMKALKGSAEEKSLTQRYVGQLNQQEDRLATLNKEADDLQQQRNKLDEQLQTMAQNINLDETM